MENFVKSHVCLKELNVSCHLDHICRGWQKDGLALAERYFHAVGGNQNGTTLQSDENHETVKFAVVERHWLVKVVDCRSEERARDELYSFVFHRDILSAVIVLHRVVNGLGGFLCVELSVVAFLVLALVVVDAVGDVARLLYFSDERPFAYCMDSSCRYKEAVVSL